MGISIREILAVDFFKNFEVISGSQGVYKEVQGIASLEAPDCFKWAKGRELVLSSGYVISKDPACIRRAFEEGTIQKVSGLIIKKDRYLHEIPEEMAQLFDKYNIPLIQAPFNVSWMDISNQINTAVMNRTIARFKKDRQGRLFQQTYKDKQIRDILRQVEADMKFPAMLYDLQTETSYYSSPLFNAAAEKLKLSPEIFWNTDRPHEQKTLCGYIGMSRIRLLKENGEAGPLISWIRIPLIVNQVTQAYFIVLESHDLIDYYDEFSIRVAYLILQSLYEMIAGAKDMEEISFENFVQMAVSQGPDEMPKLAAQADLQGIVLSTRYEVVLFCSCRGDLSLLAERDLLHNDFLFSPLASAGRLVILDDHEGLILLSETRLGREKIESLLASFQKKLTADRPDCELNFAIDYQLCTVTELPSAIEKCRRILRTGRMLYPEKTIWDNEMLGPMAWISIPDEELAAMTDRYRQLMETEKDRELLVTLKLYLENNMNYSITAEKMYLHINTIRKRIDRVSSLIDIDWDDPLERMKQMILLRLLGL